MRAGLEESLRDLFDAGDLRGMASLAVKEYGPEINGFLVAGARGDVDPAEAFARFCERLWRNLPQFRWDSSFRTWAYLLARYVLLDLSAETARRPRPISLSREARTLAASVRSSTAPYRRTSVKDRFVRLRDKLDADDRALLILRVDRDLPWRDIARVMDAGEPALRKRFERVKERLKELAREEGVIPG